MIEIKSKDLTKEYLSRHSPGNPILLCTAALRIRRVLEDASYQNLNLNLALSRILTEDVGKVKGTNISLLVRQIVEDVVGPVLLDNFEMLFDPRYQLDVIRLFVELSRKKQLAVVCSDYITGERFKYSEPQYNDYHVYDLTRYTVFCVR